MRRRGTVCLLLSVLRRECCSKSVGLIKIGKLVTACGLDGFHSRKVSTIFLLVDRECLPVLVHARIKPRLLSIAQRPSAEVEAARAELVRHFGELVIGELLSNGKVSLVVQVCLRA